MVTVKKKIQRGQKENHQQKKREEEEETDRPPVTRATAATVTKKNNWIRFVKAGKLFFFVVHNFVFFFKFYFRNQKKIQRVESRIRCARRRPPIERQPVLSFFFFKGVHRPPLYSLSTLCRRILRLRPTDRW